MRSLLIKRVLTVILFTYAYSAYRRDFDETKYWSFLVQDDKLLEKYNKIWGIVRGSINKKFDSESVNN